jgi:hypothetical protein
MDGNEATRQPKREYLFSGQGWVLLVIAFAIAVVAASCATASTWTISPLLGILVGFGSFMVGFVGTLGAILGIAAATKTKGKD